MPTPMPIIAANCGVKLAKFTNPAPTPIRKNAGISASNAVKIGSPAAVTDPKAMSRMTTAAASPTSSELPGGSRSPAVATMPPSSTCRSLRETSSRHSKSASMLASSTSFAPLSYWAVARAIVPSGEMRPGSS